MTRPADWPEGRYAAILADPPWHWKSWSDFADNPKAFAQISDSRSVAKHYSLLSNDEIAALPVSDLAAPDCVLFLWFCWPQLRHALDVIDAWGFTYKTCAFAWMKANPRQIDLFREDADVDMLLGYWTRANSEACLLATRGKPKRLAADVRQGIIEPRREHSRKPDCVHERIERLVAGPYLELFARQTRPGWTAWGNEVGKFDAEAA